MLKATRKTEAKNNTVIWSFSLTTAEGFVLPLKGFEDDNGQVTTLNPAQHKGSDDKYYSNFGYKTEEKEAIVDGQKLKVRINPLQKYVKDVPEAIAKYEAKQEAEG